MRATKPKPASKPEPPHNYEAEQALLGAIFANNAVWHRVKGFLQPDHFADALHGRIYEACARLIEAGHIANPITLKRQFDQDGALAEIGGAKYLVDLAQAVVTVINAEDYGTAVRDLYVRRQLIEIAEDMIADAYQADPMRSPFDVLNGAGLRLEDVANQPGNLPADKAIRSIGDVMTDVVAQAESARENGAAARGIEVGLIDVDRMVNGLCAGDLFVVAARPGMGKTALALTMARHAAKHDKQVGIESIEMTDTQLGLRSVAADSGVSTIKVRRATIDDADLLLLRAAADAIRDLPIHVAASGSPTMDEIGARWRAHKVRHGLDILILDYLQLVRIPGNRLGRYEEVTAVSGALKALAKTLGVPVVALSQLSRAVENRDNKRPTLGDLRESGAIEQDADQVAFLYRHQYYLEKDEPQKRTGESNDRFTQRMADWQAEMAACTGVAEVIVAKNRHGHTGTAKVRFVAGQQKFENLASESARDQWYQSPDER